MRPLSAHAQIQQIPWNRKTSHSYLGMSYFSLKFIFFKLLCKSYSKHKIPFCSYLFFPPGFTKAVGYTLSRSGNHYFLKNKTLFLTNLTNFGCLLLKTNYLWQMSESIVTWEIWKVYAYFKTCFYYLFIIFFELLLLKFTVIKKKIKLLLRHWKLW